MTWKQHYCGFIRWIFIADVILGQTAANSYTCGMDIIGDVCNLGRYEYPGLPQTVLGCSCVLGLGAGADDIHNHVACLGHPGTTCGNPGTHCGKNPGLACLGHPGTTCGNPGTLLKQSRNNVRLFGTTCGNPGAHCEKNPGIMLACLGHPGTTCGNPGTLWKQSRKSVHKDAQTAKERPGKEVSRSPDCRGLKKSQLCLLEPSVPATNLWNPLSCQTCLGMRIRTQTNCASQRHYI